MARLTPLIPPERQWILTSQELVDVVREAVPQVPASQVLAEPVGRNTAPAIGLAAAILLEQGGDPAFAVLPSDHLIEPGAEFRACLQQALEFADRDPSLLTFGIAPTRPESGYGYIEAGKAVEGHEGFSSVRSFREKPPVEEAREYLASGHHYWNSGIFCWKASTVLDGLVVHAPGIHSVVTAIAAAGTGGNRCLRCGV